ncbi:MAG TPA: GAF domain-containing protein [Anaeromyxobacteraceae bacterium]|nr:GAF domain-containing protein [Anaeromyxobacteraceae bacterium]
MPQQTRRRKASPRPARAGRPAAASPPPAASAPGRDALRFDRLERLQALTAALSAALTPEEVAQLIIGEGFGLVPARAVMLYWEQPSGDLALVYGFGVSEAFAERHRRLDFSARSPATDAHRSGESVWLGSRAEIASRYPGLSYFDDEEGDTAAVAIPVRVAGGGGVLGLLFDAPRAFEPEERKFVLAVARQCAQALERAYLFAAQRKLAERVAGLQEATAALSAAAAPPEVASVALRALDRVGARDGAIFYLTGPDRLELLYEHLTDPASVELLRRMSGGAESPVADAFHEGRAVWLDTPGEIRAAYPALEPLRARRDDAAWVALPLAVEGRTLGVLTFALPAGRKLDPDDRPYAVALAQQCALALERSRAYEGHKRLGERLSALHATSAALSGAVSPAEILDHAFRALAILGASAAELHAVDSPERVTLLARAGAVAGAAPEPAAWDAPVPAAEVVRTGRALWLETPEEIGARYPRLEPVRKWRGEGAWAVVPLLAGGRTIGALLAAFPGPRRFDAEERNFLRALAQPCAQAVERSRLFETAAAQHAEAEHAAAELEALIRQAPVGLALLDAGMRYARVNRALAELHGMPVEEHRGRTPAELWPGAAGEAIATTVRRVLETREAVLDLVVTGETAAAPGTTRRFRGSFYPVHVGERVVGVGLLVQELPP